MNGFIGWNFELHAEKNLRSLECSTIVSKKIEKEIIFGLREKSCHQIELNIYLRILDGI